MQTHPAAKSIDALVDTLHRNTRRDRTSKYMHRVEEHMAEMGPDAKLEFLRAELEKWFKRYKAFQVSLFNGDPLTSDVTAWDYAETMAAVSVRIGQLERQKVMA